MYFVLLNILILYMLVMTSLVLGFFFFFFSKTKITYLKAWLSTYCLKNAYCIICLRWGFVNGREPLIHLMLYYFDVRNNHIHKQKQWATVNSSGNMPCYYDPPFRACLTIHMHTLSFTHQKEIYILKHWVEVWKRNGSNVFFFFHTLAPFLSNFPPWILAGAVHTKWKTDPNESFPICYFKF